LVEAIGSNSLIAQGCRTGRWRDDLMAGKLPQKLRYSAPAREHDLGPCHIFNQI
jgi:hypothetical protein